jgi:actin-related protein
VLTSFQLAYVKAAKDNRHLTQQRRRDQRSSDIAKAAEDYDRRKAAEQARLIVEEAQHIAAEESRIRDREAARLQAVEDARRRDEEEARRKAEEEERRRVVEEEREQARRMREQAQEAQFQTRSLEEATVTLKHVALGSIMTFGAGLEVHSVIPAFACRMIRIKNLPANARDHEIRDLFTQQGIEAERFHVISCKPTRDGKQQATAVVPAELTTVLTAAIDGVEFRDDKLEFEVCGNHLSGGMNTSSSRNASSLTVSWRSPSVRFVAEYDDIPRAQARAEALNKTIHGGRRLSVDMNTLPPGRVVSGYNAASISIQGLPRTVTEDEVRTLAETACIRRLLYKNGIESQSVPEDAFNQILREVEQISPGTVNRHESVVQDRERELDGIVAYTIHFSSSDAACLVYDRLHQRVFPGVSPKALWLTPPQPFSFGITIPCGQYDAQKKLWDQLAHVLSEKECKLVAKQAKDVVSLRLYGRAQRSIGIAKVRVEVLASGQAIPGWNRSLCSPNNGFFVQVSRSTGAHVRIDWRKQTICAYGESGPIESAREMVAAELKRLETQEHTVRLKDTSVGFFVRRGIDALKELVGPEAVDFQPSTRRITITGGEMALHHLTRLVKESADQGHTHAATDSDCPICFCPVSSPCRIGCDHVYCEGCLVDWFTNAIENKEFPLLCIANEARCERPISIPTIKRLLPQAKMRELLETAAKSYIRTHAADFKYCKTPDCAQIYRVSDSASASTLQCPACFAEVCTGCGQDGHEDTTCEEQQRMLRWSLDDEWMKGQGLKKCPTCGRQPPLDPLRLALTLVSQGRAFKRMTDVITSHAGQPIPFR